MHIDLVNEYAALWILRDFVDNAEQYVYTVKVKQNGMLQK